jgi:hypothetical protein
MPSQTKLDAAYAYSSSAQNSFSTFSRIRMLGQIFGTGMLTFSISKMEIERINRDEKILHATNF